MSVDVILLFPPAATNRLTALISSARVTVLLAKTKIKAMIVRIRIAFRVRKVSNVKDVSESYFKCEEEERRANARRKHCLFKTRWLDEI